MIGKQEEVLKAAKEWRGKSTIWTDGSRLEDKELGGRGVVGGDSHTIVLQDRGSGNP